MGILRRSWVMVLVLVLLAALTGWAGGKQEGAGQKVIMRFEIQTVTYESKGMQKVFAKFKEQHPEVEFKFETGAENEIRTKMKTELASGGISEIYMFWGGYGQIKPFWDAGVALDMDEYFKVSKVNKREMWGEGAQATFSVGGKLIGLPQNSFSTVWINNKALFDKFGLAYPKTLAEMKAVAKVFNANGIIPMAMGSVNGNPSHLFYSLIQCQFSDGLKDLQDVQQTWKINTEAAVRAGKFIAEMREAGVFPKDTVAGGDWGPNTAQFAEEKAAMISACPWQLPAFEPIADKCDFGSTPRMPGADIDPAGISTGGAPYGLYLNPKAWNNPKLRPTLLAFADVWASDESFLEFVYLDGVDPAKKVNIDTSKLSKMLAKYYTRLKGVRQLPNHWALVPDPETWNNFNYYMDELWAGSTTPEQALQKLQAIMDKNKPKS